MDKIFADEVMSKLAEELFPKSDSPVMSLIMMRYIEMVKEAAETSETMEEFEEKLAAPSIKPLVDTAVKYGPEVIRGAKNVIGDVVRGVGKRLNKPASNIAKAAIPERKTVSRLGGTLGEHLDQQKNKFNFRGELTPTPRDTYNGKVTWASLVDQIKYVLTKSGSIPYQGKVAKKGLGLIEPLLKTTGASGKKTIRQHATGRLALSL
jgi:hypothetical protein